MSDITLPSDLPIANAKKKKKEKKYWCMRTPAFIPLKKQSSKVSVQDDASVPMLKASPLPCNVLFGGVLGFQLHVCNCIPFMLSVLECFLQGSRFVNSGPMSLACRVVNFSMIFIYFDGTCMQCAYVCERGWGLGIYMKR